MDHPPALKTPCCKHGKGDLSSQSASRELTYITQVRADT